MIFFQCSNFSVENIQHGKTLVIPNSLYRMKSPGNCPVIVLILLLGCLSANKASTQMITGFWKGKIHRQNVELKIIREGDSLRGTSYYYESVNNYRRYSIRGYFDSKTNEAVWWDDQLLDEKSGRFSISVPGKTPMLSRADFNCPGGSKMMLDGKVTKKEEETKLKGTVHLEKTTTPFFEDEWDYVIDNYLMGGNDPDIIDSIAHLSQPSISIHEEPVKTIPDGKPSVIIPDAKQPGPKIDPEPERPQPVEKIIEPVKPLTIEEKFISRKKLFIKDIPVTGDSIELRFYDNAEIDGDSISLFLNDKLLFQPIRLTGHAYTIRLAVTDLNQTNELIMVAENMGAIPPNTSYMVAIINNER